MSTNPIFARRFWLLVVGIAAMFVIAGLPQSVFAQSAPPAPAAKPLSGTTNEDTTITLVADSVNSNFNYDPRYKLEFTPAGVATQSNNGTKFTIVYMPPANQFGTFNFSYRICETVTPGPGNENSPCTSNAGASANVTITVNSVNDNPVAGSDIKNGVVPGQQVTIAVTANDNPGPNEAPPVDSITVNGTLVTQPTLGTAVVSGNNVIYTAKANADIPACVTTPGSTVQDQFSYRIRDSFNATAIGQVTVNITCEDAPVVTDPTLYLSEPYDQQDQTFKVNVILKSPSVAVGAVDFVLLLDTCLLDTDPPSSTNGFDDDVTSLLPITYFPLLASDLANDLNTGLNDPDNRVRMIASNAGPGGMLPALASSSVVTRPLGSIMMASNPLCAGNGISATLSFTDTFFADIDGQEITRTVGTKDGVQEVDLATEINNAPTDIQLTDPVVPTSASNPYDYVGTLVTSDVDEGDVFTYTILAQEPSPTVTFVLGGDPGDPNANADELNLLINDPASGTYTLTIQVMDNYGGVFTKTINVEVLPVIAPNVAPIAQDDGVTTTIPVTTMTTIDTVLNNDRDPDGAPGCGDCTIQSVTNGSYGNVTTDGDTLDYQLTDISWTRNVTSVTDVFTYTMSDNDAMPLTDMAAVTVTITRTQLGAAPVGSPLYGKDTAGDCNGNGRLEAGDLTALTREIFDGDGSAWSNANDPDGDYDISNPYGCDANKDNLIGAADISCTIIRIFGGTCSAVTAANAGTATLAVADSVNATRGGTVSIPVALTSGGNAVSAAVFAVNFDADKFDFDSVEVQANADMLSDVNATAGRVEIAIANDAAFADGTVVMVNLTVKEDAADGNYAISVSDSTLGSVDGAEVSVQAVDGSIQIGEVVFSDFIYLPFIGR